MKTFFSRLLLIVFLLLVWWFTTNLPFWSFEMYDSGSFSLHDSMTTMINDFHHFSFINLLILVMGGITLFKPSWGFNVLMFYAVCMVCGWLGFGMEESAQLEWGWYVHFVTFLVGGFIAYAIQGEAFPDAE